MSDTRLLLTITGAVVALFAIVMLTMTGYALYQQNTVTDTQQSIASVQPDNAASPAVPSAPSADVPETTAPEVVVEPMGRDRSVVLPKTASENKSLLEGLSKKSEQLLDAATLPVASLEELDSVPIEPAQSTRTEARQTPNNALRPEGEIELTGVVSDQKLNPLEKVSVILTSLNLNERRFVETNHAGEYLITGLRPSMDYVINVIKDPGYEPVARQELSLIESLRLNFNLNAKANQ